MKHGATSGVRTGLLVLALILGSGAAAGACGSSKSNEGPVEAGLLDASMSGGPLDTGVPANDDAADGAPDDADAGPVPCEPPDGGDGGTSYHDINNPACWSTIATTDLSDTQSFFGGAFDGRYVYLTNTVFTMDTLLRLDTLPDGGGWQEVTLGMFDGYSLGGYQAEAYDGRYMYFVPGEGNLFVSRYDTQGSFSTETSWTEFDLAEPDGGADGGTDGGSVDSYEATDGGGGNFVGYQGAVFDGRYVYLVPYGSLSGVNSGRVARYDTTGSFGANASWSTFDTTTKDPAAAGFSGGAFDGRYLYLVPCTYTPADGGIGAVGSIAVQLDTTAAFESPASWTTFDTTAESPYAAGFSGATFDGRYVYFAPSRGQAGFFSTVVARFDTQGTFVDVAAWSAFDTSPLNPDPTVYDWDYEGAVFDGRYVTFVPTNGSRLLRYDTESAFSTTTSWTSVAVVSLVPASHGDFAGAVFDGQRIYFVSTGYGPLTIFDAKTPPAIPPAPSSLPDGYPGTGSFF
jgi:hypothetical protein